MKTIKTAPCYIGTWDLSLTFALSPTFPLF